jgi:predicted MFS family arabinose efflux permease
MFEVHARVWNDSPLTLLSAPLRLQIGAINTMVFTHLPSNLLLIAIPFMPNATWAVIVLLLRFSISQMDVPARQFYVATVVDADERSAAGGITSIVRSVGLSASPLLAGYLLADPKNTVVFR